MKNNVDKQYLNLIEHVLKNGSKKSDRTCTGTKSIFGYQTRFNLVDGFPLLTTKKLHFKSIAVELLWFLRGDTNIKFLQDNNVKIWNEWAVKETKLHSEFISKTPMSEYIKKTTNTNDSLEEIENFIKKHSYKEVKAYYNFNNAFSCFSDDDYIIQEIGDIGQTYGYQWTNFDGEVNQIEKVINSIKNNPDSRRHLVTAWNPKVVDELALPPCHYSFQFYVKELDVHERIGYFCSFNGDEQWNKEWLENGLGVWHDNADELYKNKWRNNATKVLDGLDIPTSSLSCMFNMRSSDVFLGLPYNIASYALLTHMIAHQCGLAVGELVWSGGDIHIYDNHIEQVNEQLKRKPYELPTLNIKRKPESIFDYNYDDFEVLNYNAHPNIKGKVAV